MKDRTFFSVFGVPDDLTYVCKPKLANEFFEEPTGNFFVLPTLYERSQPAATVLYQPRDRLNPRIS